MIQDMIPGLMKSDLQENNASTSGYRKLLGLTGKYSGTEIPIGPNQKIILGRDASAASLVVNGEKISRVHCSIQFSEGAQNNYIITDHSSNGVFVDGKRIPRDLLICVSAGSIIALADGANKFQLE